MNTKIRPQVSLTPDSLRLLKAEAVLKNLSLADYLAALILKGYQNDWYSDSPHDLPDNSSSNSKNIIAFPKRP